MKISNLNISYPTSNFNLNIQNMKIIDNKINIIIGENGCGKSVLVKEIQSRNDAILMMQSPYIFDKTVRKTLLFIKRISSSNVDIEEIVELVNLNNKIDVEALSLSGGQKQRLALAMALISDKSLIILDEPFNGIDVYSQKLIVDLIKTMKHKTFIIVTHKINHAKRFGDWFIFMQNGKIIAEGEKTKFFNTDIVKEFVLLE